MYNTLGHHCRFTDRVAVAASSMIGKRSPSWVYIENAKAYDIDPWCEVSVVRRDPIIMSWGEVVLRNGANLGYNHIDDVVVYVDRKDANKYGNDFITTG